MPLNCSGWHSALLDLAAGLVAAIPAPPPAPPAPPAPAPAPPEQLADRRRWGLCLSVLAQWGLGVDGGRRFACPPSRLLDVSPCSPRQLGYGRTTGRQETHPLRWVSQESSLYPHGFSRGGGTPPGHGGRPWGPVLSATQEQEGQETLVDVHTMEEVGEGGNSTGRSRRRGRRGRRGRGAAATTNSSQPASEAATSPHITLSMSLGLTPLSL